MTPQTSAFEPIGGPLSVRRVRLDRGGYVMGRFGGQYFGRGQPLYLASDGGEFYHYLRATDRADAVAQFAERFPEARFLRGVR